MGLNVVVGMAGLLDLGYAAFFAIGAYTYAYGSVAVLGHSHFPFLPMLVVGAAVAAVFGIPLGAPTLRLRGDYLAIVTLGFGEIVPDRVPQRRHVTERHQRHRRHRPAGAADHRAISRRIDPWPYYVTDDGVIVTIVMILLYRLQDSPDRPGVDGDPRGRAAAAANGINTVTTKLLAFALGARRRASPACSTPRSSSSSARTSSVHRLVHVLAMVVLGGMGNIWGVAVGAFIVYMIQTVVLKQLNHVLRQLQSRCARIRAPADDRLHPVPVPAVRHRAGGDDAVAARGPVPEPAATARAASPTSRPEVGAGSSRRAPGMPDRRRAPTRTSGGRPAQSATGDRRGRDVLVAPTKRHQALRRPRRGQRRRLHDPGGLDRQPHRANGAGKTTFFNIIAGIYRPDRRADRVPRPPDDRPRPSDLAGALHLGRCRRSSSRSSPSRWRRSACFTAGVDARRHRRCGAARRVVPGRRRPARRGTSGARPVRHLPQRPSERHGRGGPRPDLPEHPAVPEHDRAGERPGRACTRGSRPTWLDALFSHAARPARGEVVARRGRSELLALVGLKGRATTLAKNLPVRRPAPAGDRARAGAASPKLLLLDEPTAGMNPQRDAGADGAHQPAAQRARPHGPAHRARHARRHGHQRPHHGPRPRREDRRGHARRGPQQPEGHRGLPRGSRRHDRDAAGAGATARPRATHPPARGRPHLLRPHPRAPGHRRWRSVAARSSRSSAPTAPARRRRSRRSAACSTRARAASTSTATTSRRRRPTSSSSWASGMPRKAAGSSRG